MKTAPNSPTFAAREFVNPKTGGVHTLTYERTPTGHLIRHETPFGFPVKGGQWFATDVQDARRHWTLMRINICRIYGLKVAGK